MSISDETEWDAIRVDLVDGKDQLWQELSRSDVDDVDSLVIALVIVGGVMEGLHCMRSQLEQQFTPSNAFRPGLHETTLPVSYVRFNWFV